MKRYQIFISSTYKDLQEERQEVLKSILKLRHIPVGMEHFVATNEEQFEYIKRLLDETDYYVVIIGNRYGSIGDDGISYTEKEFDYAVNLGIPVIACVHSNPDSLPVNKSDVRFGTKQKLKDFRKKVMHHRMVSYFNWDNPAELSAEVVVALVNKINDEPRPGWERVSSFENSDLLNQINDLRIKNDKMKLLLEQKQQFEEQEQQIMKFPWETVYTFKGYSKWKDYKDVDILVTLTWSQIFSIIAPNLLVKKDIDLVHYAVNHTLFLDREPYFAIPKREFNIIIAKFFEYGIIDFINEDVYLTKLGRNCLNTIMVSVDEELNLIHKKVYEIINNNSKNLSGEISNYISLLSDFSSNPETSNYIGKTLLSLRVFLGKQTSWDKEQIENSQKIIEDILNDASESERIDNGIFDPVFNLSKIMKLIDFLNTKLHTKEI